MGRFRRTRPGQRVRGQDVGQDELLVVHETATAPHTIVNDGDEELLLIKFFGPDIIRDVPAVGLRPVG